MENGRIYCSFSRYVDPAQSEPPNATQLDKVYNLEQDLYYLLLAKGPVNSTSLVSRLYSTLGSATCWVHKLGLPPESVLTLNCLVTSGLVQKDFHREFYGWANDKVNLTDDNFVELTIEVPREILLKIHGQGLAPAVESRHFGALTLQGMDWRSPCDLVIHCQAAR